MELRTALLTLMAHADHGKTLLGHLTDSTFDVKGAEAMKLSDREVIDLARQLQATSFETGKVCESLISGLSPETASDE